jgi:hypothetical protein
MNLLKSTSDVHQLVSSFHANEQFSPFLCTYPHVSFPPSNPFFDLFPSLSTSSEVSRWSQRLLLLVHAHPWFPPPLFASLPRKSRQSASVTLVHPSKYIPNKHKPVDKSSKWARPTDKHPSNKRKPHASSSTKSKKQVIPEWRTTTTKESLQWVLHPLFHCKYSIPPTRP